MEALKTGDRGWGTGLGKRGLLLILAVLLLIRVPFLNQAIQGDDHIYLSEAAHALVEPLHPAHTTYVFLGDDVDLRGLSHPPLNALVLAGLIGCFGDVKEIPFHAAYLVFSLIAAAAMVSLARRFSPRPVWATLLFLAVPAFVVNGSSLESDLPFLAFWMASVALFCSGRVALSAAAMVLAAMTAYQAIFLTPILGVWLLISKPARPRRAWLAIFVPAITLAAWQAFERLSTGTLPAHVITGYFTKYGFQALHAKMLGALALFVHSWFIVFPALIPGAALLAWRKRRDPDTLFLLAWIVLFFGGAVVVFFAGSARYLLPMAAPVALLVSRQRVRWLALGFAAQMALSLGLSVVNYQHWEGCRAFAATLRGPAAGHRVWVNGEWGLRQYVEADGGLALTKTRRVQPGDVVVSSALGHSVDLTAPSVPLLTATIQPAIPLRLIGLDSHSGYSTASRGLWPFGVSNGPIDVLTAVRIEERHPTLEALPMNALEASAQIVSGIYSLEENRYRWMSRHAVIALKSPAEALPLRITFAIPERAGARTVSLLLDGRQVASRAYSDPGAYTLESPPVRATGAVAMVEITLDHTFSAPGDARDLGIVLTAVGFAR